MRFRKKPIVIEAIRWTGFNTKEIWDFCPTAELHRVPEWEGIDQVNAIAIKTLEGEMLALEGDWIIKGIKGEFYPCKPDIFEATYEPVESAPSTNVPLGKSAADTEVGT